jgi:Cys-rich protein (TIGR01571 family)
VKEDDIIRNTFQHNTTQKKMGAKPTRQERKQDKIDKINNRRAKVQESIPKREWSTDLFACSSDQEICCMEIFCSRIIVSRKVEQFAGDSCIYAFLCLEVSEAHTRLRIAARDRYKIHGNNADDRCIGCFCAPCSTCQVLREEKYVELGKARGAMLNNNNFQQGPPVAMQMTTTIT